MGIQILIWINAVLIIVLVIEMAITLRDIFRSHPKIDRHRRDDDDIKRRSLALLERLDAGGPKA